VIVFYEVLGHADYLMRVFYESEQNTFLGCFLIY